MSFSSTVATNPEDDKILYVEKSKDSTKLSELINEFSKVARNSHYTNINFISIHNNEQFEKEIVKTVLLIIAAKGIKYLGRDVTKEVQDLYTANCKTSLTESKEDINRKTSHVRNQKTQSC